jgi:tetratricopeptide (TPR) repeat protein
MNVDDRSRKAGRAPRRTWRSAIPILVLTLAVAGTYSNTLRNGFHLDDFYRIRDNPEIRRVTPVLRHFADPGTISGSRGVSESVLNQIGQYRPLLPLTLSLNYAAGALDLPGYHLVNIALHLAGCVLVFFLVTRLLVLAAPKGIGGNRGARLAALLVALVYAVHPVSGYPVNYILARDLLLMQAFLLGSLLVYTQSSERLSAWRWITALIFLELALLSKITAVVAPLLIVFWEWTISGRNLRTWRPWARAAPFAVVVGAHIGLARLLLDFGNLSRVQSGVAWSWTYALTQADVHVSEYLKNFLWPEAVRMAPHVVPRTSLGDPRVLLGLAVIVATMMIAVKLRRAAPAGAFAILGYWALMIPESSVIPISHLAVHYRAFPSSWLLYVAVCLLIARVVQPRLALALGTAAAIVLAAASFSMNRVYRSETSLWAHSVRHGGEALAHMNYAMSLSDRTDPQVREHLEQAVEMSPNYVLAHVNLGLLTMDLGQTDAGLARLRWVTRMAPDWPEAHYWLSVALDRAGELDEATVAAQAAAALDPENLQYEYRLALARSRAGDFEGALEASRRVLEIDPGHADARFVEAYALQMTGSALESTRVFGRYLEARPDDAEARFDLAYAWVSLGRCSDAEAHLRTILRAHPGHAAAEQYLHICEEEDRGGSPAEDEALERQYEAAFAAYRSGDYRRSLEFLRLVEAMSPSYADALFLKGFDLQMLGRLEEAVTAYDAYLSTHPDHAQVHFNIGHALASLGRCPDAVGHLERTLQVQPDYQEARETLSRCLEAGAGIRSAGAAGSDRING